MSEPISPNPEPASYAMMGLSLLLMDCSRADATPTERARRPQRRASIAAMDAPFPLLQLRALCKTHGASVLFEGVDLDVCAGEFVAIVGESGVGKSTLLNCIAGLDHSDAGSVHIDAAAMNTLPEPEQALLRRRLLGFVFQAFHVLPYLSVARNVALPLLLLGRDDPGRVERLLGAVGLQGMGARMPQTLSGGELQRVAIARAVVHAPKLILADEPTGNLDPATARRVLETFRDQVRLGGAACILVTHSPAAAAFADRVLVLSAKGLRPR